MMRPTTEVRGATPDEMPRAIAAIVAAFLTDPIARFAWPSSHDPLRAMFALRRRTSARPIAPLAPAIRTLIASSTIRSICRPASRSLVVDRGLGAVIRDDVGDQPRRLGLARIGADEVVALGGSVQLWPAL